MIRVLLVVAIPVGVAAIGFAGTLFVIDRLVARFVRRGPFTPGEDDVNNV